MLEAKYFLKLDASSGYWQIKVDRESSNLLTFGTTIIRFYFKWLPYSIHSAHKVFQKTVLSIISDIQDCKFSDDIVIWGKTLAEHDNRFQNVLCKVRESGLKLNKNKCQFHKNTIVFLGHMISSEGIRVDPSKTYAITKMSIPQSLTELERFLGMVNYLGKFIPNFAEVTAPFQVLLKKGIVFNLQKIPVRCYWKVKNVDYVRTRQKRKCHD